VRPSQRFHLVQALTGVGVQRPFFTPPRSSHAAAAVARSSAVDAPSLSVLHRPPRFPGDSAASPCTSLVTWLVTGAVAAGMVAAAGLVCESASSRRRTR